MIKLFDFYLRIQNKRKKLINLKLFYPTIGTLSIGSISLIDFGAF